MKLRCWHPAAIERLMPFFETRGPDHHRMHRHAGGREPTAQHAETVCSTGGLMNDVRIARKFDACLPRLSKPVRISSFHDAQIFVRRRAIRDKDRAIRALCRRMDRANSSESADTAIRDMKRELADRGLLPHPESPVCTED
jgi:hypothetical protein